MSTLRRNSNWLVDTIRNRPEGLLLVAGGCALLFRSGRTGRRTSSFGEPGVGTQQQEWKRASVATTESRGGREHASSFAQTAVEQARGITSATGEYIDSAGEYIDSARQTVVEHSSDLVDRTRSAVQGVIQDQPFVVALAGFAAGAAVAAIFPPSQVERDTLGEAGRRLTDAATTAGERLTEAATAAGQRLKTAVVTDTLADVARDVAGSFKKSVGESSGSSSYAGSAQDTHSTTSSAKDFTSKTN